MLVQAIRQDGRNHSDRTNGGMKARRILFCHASAELYGADYVLLELCRHLRRRGIEPLVIVPFRGPLCDEFDRAEVEYRVTEIPVLRRQCFTPLGIIKFAYLMMTSLQYFARVARESGAEIYHTNTAGVWTAGILARIQGRRHIWQVMEIVEQPRIVAYLMAKAVGCFSSRVFCISNAVRDHFVRYNRPRRSRFETLYHGVDLQQFDPQKAEGREIRRALGIPAGAVVILYAGRFSSWKGQDVFAHAISRVLKQPARDLDLRFVMLGSCFPGQEHNETELRSILAGIPDAAARVSLPGFQKNLQDWLSAADIFVLPSKRPEPNATVLIAAMAMGLPCIGTAIGGTVETLVPDVTGLLVPPADPDALADAMRTLATDAEKRARMGRAGRERALAMFSLDHYCRTVEASYA